MQYSIKTSFGDGNNQALQICKEITGLVPPSDEDLIFNFSTYGENNPFSNLLIINTLRQYRKEYSDASLRCAPKTTDGYLSHIGFYKACGIQYGKEPGEARASSNYVPVTYIKTQGTNFYQSIEEKANQLAGTLRFDKGLQEMLSYIFVETIRNVYEHANTDNVLVAAQKWPTYDLVEIAISDDGCGITESLGKLFSTDSLGLLRLACEPGVSAKSNYRYLDKDDPWRNSGYGLYIMKELALTYGGSFLLCSGNHAIRYRCDESGIEVEELYDTAYHGTTIGIRFKTNMENDFDAIRKRIISEGQVRAARIKGAIRSASRSSGGRYRI